MSMLFGICTCIDELVAEAAFDTGRKQRLRLLMKATMLDKSIVWEEEWLDQNQAFIEDVNLEIRWDNDV